MNLNRLLLLICILIIAEPALALRCGSKLVNDGDHKSKILRYCGEPTSVQVRTTYRAGFPSPRLRQNGRDSIDRDGLLYADRSYVEIIVEEWTYNFGPRRLMQIIKFENGLVISIKRLGYGFLE